MASHRRHLFTSESVTEGHPDKVADAISDAVLDAILSQDAEGRVACETLVTTGLVLIAGEISTRCYIDIPTIARRTVCDIGYTRAKYGFDGSTCAVLTTINEQSPDIARGVNEAWEIREEQRSEHDNLLGAGDQGIMFGYATNETAEMMPMPIFLANRLARRLAEVRRQGELVYLRPDGKTQVSVEYEGDRAVRVEAVVISTQHDPDIGFATLRSDINEMVIRPVLAEYLDTNTRIFINPTGLFTVGGPQGDTGLTGRKIIVDTYGGMARHGGGAMSGKDPTKVDRSAAYALRYVAKNLVAAGLAARVELQVAYAIGVAHPVSIRVDSFGTGIIPDADLDRLVREHFDLRPSAIIRDLHLKRPIYRPLAAYGHFGRTDLDLPWENTDKAAELRKAALG